MAELTPIPSAQRPAEPGYQPLSGYAVAAAVVSGAFAIALIVLVVIGLTSRRTPLTYELLVVAGAGVVLAIAGRSHVRNSEGTRTGLQLANGAWWVSVLGGAGFAAFLLANEFVLRAESQRRADSFLETLKAGKEQEAFTFTLPPELQGRADPGSPDFATVYGPYGYPTFASHRLLQAFRRNVTPAQIEHMGARDVGQEGNGFKATHTYRITVTEGEFTVQIKLIAAESRSGGKPQWHIQSAQGLGITEPKFEYFSQYGRLVMETENEAAAMARDWMFDLSNNRPGRAGQYLRPRSEREPALNVIRDASFLSGASPYALPATGGVEADFERLTAAGFFRRDANGNPLTESKSAKLRGEWRNPYLVPASAARRGPMPSEAEAGMFLLGPNSVTVGVPADLIYGLGGQMTSPSLVGVVCSDPALVAALTAARDKGAAAKDDGSVSLRSLPARDWRVAWFQTALEDPPPSDRPGGGPRMPPRGP